MLSGNPLEQFIAASWSLDQHSNTVAIKVLRQLAGRDDPDGMMTRVSQLAAFQVYRCEISSLSNKDLLRWRRAIEKMHRLDRAGPIWMAGNLMQNNENYLSAAAEFLKLPILYPEHYFAMTFHHQKLHRFHPGEGGNLRPGVRRRDFSNRWAF